MAKKISELIEATSIEDADLIPIVQSGVNKKITKANFGGGLGYLVYVASLTQTGTSAPAAVALQNTLGAGAWTRFESGGYESITTTDYPDSASKIYIPGFTNENGGSGDNPYFMPFVSGGIELFNYNITTYEDGGKIVLFMQVRNPDSVSGVDLSEFFTGANNFSLPEIRVYP